MSNRVSIYSILTIISIAIQTAMFTCVVCTDIDAGNATTLCTLIGVFSQSQPAFPDTFKSIFIYTARMGDIEII